MGTNQEVSSSFRPSVAQIKNQDVKLYIKYLEKENLRLQKQIAKLQVTNLSKLSEIKGKDKQIKKLSSYLKNKVRIGLPGKLPVPIPPGDKS